MKAYVASHLKDMNRQKVYNLIKSNQPTSKAEISKMTGISSPTVIKIVNFLVEKGIVIEIGEVETAIGRRPHMLQINTKLMYSAGFVLEGDFLSMGIADILGNVIYKKNIRVESDYTYIMERIKNHFVDELLEESGIEPEKLFGIGIALPVIYDKERNVIYGAPLINREEEYSLEEDIEELSRKFHAIIMVENDTNAQTIGEFQKGGYEAKDDLLFISAGTGLGAGLIIDGRLRRGASYMCGEIGYTSFDAQYQCSSKSCGWLEDNIGHRRLGKNFGVDVTNPEENIPDSTRKEMIEYVAKPLALCINNINACIDCRNVVLGGKVVENLGQPLLDEMNQYMESLCMNHTVVKSELSEDVGLIGITWLLTNKKIVEILTEEE